MLVATVMVGYLPIRSLAEHWRVIPSHFLNPIHCQVPCSQHYPMLLLGTRPSLFEPICYGRIQEETYLVCVAFILANVYIYSHNIFLITIITQDRAVFNFRLSRARRIIENSFGILAARYCTSMMCNYLECVYIHNIYLYTWRLFRRHILSQPDGVVTYTEAAIALHNYLRTTESSVYCPPGFTDGEDGEDNVIEGAWRTDNEQSTAMEHVQCTSSNRYVFISLNAQTFYVYTPPLLYTRHSRSAASIRDSYKHYFISSQGEVSWQYSHVRRTQ